MSTQDTPKAEAPAAAEVRIPPTESPRHEEGLLDQALAETFPASDPISPSVESRLISDARWGRRLKRAAPSLVALGAAALVLFATRSRRPRVH